MSMKASLVAAALSCAFGCTGEIVGGPPSDNTEVGFAVPRDRIELLPYHVRVQRLRDVARLTERDPALAVLAANANDLGDHDYSQGIRPKLQWNASTMSLWVKSLEPICESTAMHDRYPSFPGDLGALLEAAYGRAPTDGEVDEIWSATQGRPDEQRYQLTCLGLLSSLEFVTR